MEGDRGSLAKVLEAFFRDDLLLFWRLEWKWMGYFSICYDWYLVFIDTRCPLKNYRILKLHIMKIT